jgi:uncharacterized SAM-binding protein YcdF (DUF218 family)
VFYVLSKTLDLVVAPLFLIGLLVFLGRPRKKRRVAKWRRACPFIAIGLLYLLSIEPVANALLRTLEIPDQTTMRPDVTYDTIVLLGGVVDDAGMEGSGEPSYNDNVERLLVSYDLLRTNRAKTVIISGGAGGLVQKSPVNEARVLSDQLVAWGIDRERIIIEPEALNTRENATYSAKIIRERGFANVLLVTSAFHMKRAAGCFRAENLAFDTVAVDHRTYDPKTRSGRWLPQASHFLMSSAAIREQFGRLIYRLRGFTK